MRRWSGRHDKYTISCRSRLSPGMLCWAFCIADAKLSTSSLVYASTGMLCMQASDCSGKHWQSILYSSRLALCDEFGHPRGTALHVGDTVVVGHFQLLSDPRNLTTCPYFCSFVISWSPWRTTSLYLSLRVSITVHSHSHSHRKSTYCPPFPSSLLVSITPFTLSILQLNLPLAMNGARSLSNHATLTPKLFAILSRLTTR